MRCRKWFLLFEDFLRTLRRLRWLDAVDAILLSEVDPDPSLRDNIRLVLSSGPVSEVFERFGNMFHANFTTQELAEFRTRHAANSKMGNDEQATFGRSSNVIRTEFEGERRGEDANFVQSAGAAHGSTESVAFAESLEVSHESDVDDDEEATPSCSALPSLVAPSLTSCSPTTSTSRSGATPPRDRVSTHASANLNISKRTSGEGAPPVPSRSVGVARRKRRSKQAALSDEYRHTNHPRTKRSRHRRRVGSRPRSHDDGRDSRSSPNSRRSGFSKLGLLCVTSPMDACGGVSSIEDAAADDFSVFENIERHRNSVKLDPAHQKAAARREVDSFCSRVLECVFLLV